MRIVAGLCLLLGLAVPVLACSQHGTIAGNKVDTWLDNSDSDDTVGNTGFNVSGTQGGQEGGNAGGWHWEWYQVTVTFPGGQTVTIQTSGQNGQGWTAEDNATDLENWLANEAKNVIRQADLQSSDYIG